MRRFPILSLILAPVLIFACAQGKYLSPRDDGASGSAGSGQWGSAGADPGSGDPGGPGGPGGSSAGSDPDGDGDPGGYMGPCAHDPCVTGVALDPNCDPCVAKLCIEDVTCCANDYAQKCVDRAETCGCPSSSGGTGGSYGTGGSWGGSGGSWGGSGGFGGSYGTGGSWGGSGGFGGTFGTGGSGPVGDCHNTCDIGPPMDPSCNACAGLVCQFDDWCCTEEWDQQCVNEGDFYCGGCFD
jgi:hypothetical protein